MFLRYHVELPLATTQVEDVPAASPSGWLAAIAGQARPAATSC